MFRLNHKSAQPAQHRTKSAFVQHCRSRKSGAAIVEMAAGGIFLMIFVAISIDMALLVTCASITDRAARDVARATAMVQPQQAIPPSVGPPPTEGMTANQATVAAAQKIAAAILTSFKSASPFMTAPTVQTLVYNDYGGSPPNIPGTSIPVTPSITVTVVSSANLPFAPVTFFGSTFGNQPFAFSQTYTFPIVNTRLSS
jgi:Flp pilus assembly protein TadG